MKTATDSIAVIRTRLPYLDRRALSEAWFSALHLARDARLAVPQRRADDPGGMPRSLAPAARTATAAAGGPSNARAPLAAGRRASGSRPAAVRAEAASETVRLRSKMTSACQMAVPPPLRAAFTLTIDGARVQMLVRRDGPTLRITAICAAASVESVRRALASADLAMRLRGHLVESQVRAAGDREVPA